MIAFIRYKQWAVASRVDVHDGFETRELSKIWDTDRFAPGAVTMQSEIVRAGRGAAKVVLHSHDQFEAGVNGNKDSERAELLEAKTLVSIENKRTSIPSACGSLPIFPSCRQDW